MIRLSILLQLAVLVLGLVNRFGRGLGSDFMFGVLIFSVVNGVFLAYSALKTGGLIGREKYLALALASLPLIFGTLMALFVAGV